MICVISALVVYMDKIIILTGPTASGKTALSIKLAGKFDGEIISADSRQVYKGLTVGTDKVKLKNGKAVGIRHHLIDIASPKRTFTVAQWKKLAERAISAIHKQNKIPLIVGGTGFYIEALLYNLDFPAVKPKAALRKGLAKLSLAQLMKNLEYLDPERAATVDPHNKVRLIRAIEIAMAIGKVPPLRSPSPPVGEGRVRGKYDALILGIKKSDNELRSRINKRVVERADAIIREIKKLRRQGLSLKRLINFGLEYRFYSLYLQRALTKEQAINKSKTATWRFGRRQYTFLKRLPVVWIKTGAEAEAEIKQFLT